MEVCYKEHILVLLYYNVGKLGRTACLEATGSLCDNISCVFINTHKRYLAGMIGCLVMSCGSKGADYDDISALTEAAQQYDGASLDARLDMTYAQGGDLALTLTQSPSSITYLGDIVYRQVALDSTFDRYAAVISDCERYEQIAHAMMNDLITNRFGEPFVYSPSDLPLHVVVIGEKFILTDAPDAVADAVRVTLVGGRYTRAEQ